LDSAAMLALLLGGAPSDDNRLIAAEALLHDRLTDPDRPTLVAEVDGVVGGVALLGFHQSLRSWYATLDDLVVGSDLRRGGLGTALVEFCAALAKARGCALIQVALPEVEAGTEEFLAACGFSLGTTLARKLS
jgi:GNAT superfamily N-acetyltransferase